MEAALETVISNPQGGDGFDVVSKEVQIVHWNALGFGLPAAPAQPLNVELATAILPRYWELSTELNAPPMIMFRFPAPLDKYAGEVTDMSGELLLRNNLTITGA